MKKAAFVIGVEAQRKKREVVLMTSQLMGKTILKDLKQFAVAFLGTETTFDRLLTLCQLLRTYSMCVDVAAILWLKD